MSNKPNDGGSAFPEHFYFDEGRGAYGQNVTSSDVGCGGMTLRDYFAAKAMAQLIAHKEAVMALKPELRDSALDCERCVAESAYLQADAMIAARQCPSTPAQQQPAA